MTEPVLLLNEDEVIDRACAFLQSQGWSIRQALHGNASGIDIIAERRGTRLLVEAKGCTTGTACDRTLHIQPHRTNASIGAVGKLLYLYDGSSALALALPDDRVFRAQIEKAKRGLEKLGAAVMWVSHDQVRTWNGDGLTSKTDLPGPF